MNWTDVALAVLKLIVSFFDHLELTKQQDEALAQIGASVLAKSKFSKQIMEQVNGLSPEAVDDLLHRLEPSELSKPN